MKKTRHLKLAAWLSSFLFMILIGCSQSPEFNISRNQDFNLGWKFTYADIEEAKSQDYDDSDWRDIDLPHDWSVEDFETEDSLHTGPFYKDLPGGNDVGYLKEGTGWYRKRFNLPNLLKDQQVIIHFDGVQSMMEIWVNGNSAGHHAYGYTPFYFNITPYLNEKRSLNQISIRVTNPGKNSRWFAGAGIYRSVKLSIINPVAIDVWGLAISTPEIEPDAASVKFELKLKNYASSDAQINYKLRISAPDGSNTELATGEANISGNKELLIELIGEIKNPLLWDTKNPHLYTASVELFENDEKIDTYTSTFGIRSLSYSAEKGFLLNGKEVLLKGACLHHDNGILGAKAFRTAEERRVKIMKSNGFNAIRTSHNPPSEAFLDACDKFGMLVIDESFDAWVKPKRENDYNVHFKLWWKKDLASMLLRDRNHPSIIMWSFGNEVQERADSSGLAIAEDLINAIKSIAPGRPVTQAICEFWDNPGKTWEYTENAFALLDISGYNYQWERYEADHNKFTDRIIYGSESVPKHACENWDLVKKHPYVIGDFVWTGMDYIGESGIGNATNVSSSDEKIEFLKPWPWYVSWCGDIDITGNKKPQSYYRDVVWGNSKLEMMVHAPVQEGETEVVSFWGWPDELNSWTWPGQELKTMEVNVYSSYSVVQLKLNGELIGEQKIGKNDKYTAQFSVPYLPGDLEVVGIEDGKEMENLTLSTAIATTELRLNPEKIKIAADRNEIAFITIEALDINGNIDPTNNSLLTVSVSGEGELLSAGNGSPTINGSFHDSQLNLFRGKGLIIVRSSGQSGEIEVTISHEDLGQIQTYIRTI